MVLENEDLCAIITEDGKPVDMYYCSKREILDSADAVQEAMIDAMNVHDKIGTWCWIINKETFEVIGYGPKTIEGIEVDYGDEDDEDY